MLGSIISFRVREKGRFKKIFFESHTEGIYRTDGSILEESLPKKIQDDTPPATLNHGQIAVGLTKVWIGNAENKPLEINVPQSPQGRKAPKKR